MPNNGLCRIASLPNILFPAMVPAGLLSVFEAFSLANKFSHAYIVLLHREMQGLEYIGRHFVCVVRLLADLLWIH